MIVIFASLCLYLACLCLYHAHPRRTAFSGVRANASAPRLMRCLAATLAVLSLVLFIAFKGFEKGFSIWVGVFVAAGILSLLISALRPQDHIKSGALAIAGSAAALLYAGLGA